MGEVFKALGFMSLGMLIAEIYNMRAWNRYQRGRAEWSDARQTYSNRRYGR